MNIYLKLLLAVAAFHSTKEDDFPKYYQNTSSGAELELNETVKTSLV